MSKNNLLSNSKPKKKSSLSSPYKKFKKIDGSHDLQKFCPDSFISYKARRRKGGSVALFNFALAKEMGLISKDHPNELNDELRRNILDTFSLIIINEYDEINNISYPEDEILDNEYMATRYLQLQHPNKQGKTSGDGRSIWNGQLKSAGKTWDISSCGTGATRLSPATHINGKFYQTGDPSISYGCGYSEKDEGLATLFFSEVFNKNGIGTERLLGIIEFEKGLSINIRVHENLIRPSHMFNHLKQGNLRALNNIVDYYINKQEANGQWSGIPSSRNRKLDYFLNKEIEVFASLSAKLEDEYIFCWLDWDGDNILMDGSVIDFGSIRQFGLYHHEYRYDDVQRYSTSIKEQKAKAKQTVKTFIQLVDYLQTGEKKALASFNSDKRLDQFEKWFNHYKNINLLHKLGFHEDEVDFLESKHLARLEEFRKTFSYFEMAISKSGIEEVADGINCSAIFCMRDILREYPQLILSRGAELSCEEFISVIRSSYATDEDVTLSTYRVEKIKEFQNDYSFFVEKVAKRNKTDKSSILLKLTMRSSVINKYDRVTGDSITTIVNKVMNYRPKLKSDDINKLVSEFVEFQNLDPDSKKKKKEKAAKKVPLLKTVYKVVRDYREGL